jgi:aspartyl-tRNA(Asn)/glutamyl-tRNA(Gln) amidotransferase subunit A
MASSLAKDLCYLTIREAGSLIQRQELSPVELTTAHLQRIEELDGRLRSFVALQADEAMAEARVAEAEILRGAYRGPLHGIPVAHKDQFDARRLPSQGRPDAAQLRDVIEEATAIRKLRDAGTILLGKLEMDGWAVGIDAASQRDQARNPWDLSRSPGASSSGSGAAVAGGLSMGSMGEDSGGSIRYPASVCGIVGLKPTYGLVSRFGLLPLSWALDHGGPMTRTVEDAALMLQSTAGYDPKDPTSIDVNIPDYTAALRQDVKGIKIGVPRDHIARLGSRMDPDTLAGMERALSDLEGMGASVEEVVIPSLEYAPVVFIAMWYADTYAPRKALIQTQPEIFGEMGRSIIYQGGLIPVSDYILSQQARTRLRREYAEAMRKVDVMVSPTLPFTARPAGSLEGEGLVSGIYDLTHFMCPFNLTGTPAISVPCGFSSEGLPLGMQVLGKALDEPTVLRVAHTYEQHSGWHQRRPPI